MEQHQGRPGCGDHRCAIYETEDDLRAVATPFISRGLACNEKVLLIAEEQAAGAILDGLRSAECDPVTRQSSGQLVLRPPGALSPDEMIGLLRRETETALAEGYPALRVAEELIRTAPEQLAAYEDALNEFLAGSRCTAVCLYDRRRFSPTVLLDVLSAHPTVTIGTETFTNCNYIPPEDFRSGDRDRIRLDYWIGSLRERSSAEKTLRARTHALQERVKELRCLHGLSELVARDLPDGELFRTIVTHMPAAWQFPAAAAARIVVDGTEYRTENFRETPWRLVADIEQGGARYGTVEVCYLEERPFLAEERALIDSLAERLGRIIGHRRAERDLDRTIGKLREIKEILNQSPAVAIVWSVTPGWPMTFVSENFSQFGYDPAEFLSGSRNYNDIIHPDDRERVAAEVERYTRERRSEYAQEYRILTASGEMRWIDDRTRVERDSVGNAVHYRGIILDITARKVVEDAYRISEERFATLFRSNPDAVVVSTPEDGRVLETNNRWEEVSGYPRKEVIGRTVADFNLYAHPPDRDRYLALIKDRGTARNFETVMRTRAGDLRYVSMSGEMIEIGGKTRLLTIIHDRTEQKQAEIALRESEAKYRTLFDSAGDAIFILDPAGRILEVNLIAADRLGYSRDELLAMNVADIDDPESARLVRGRIEELRERGLTFFETVHLTRDGTAVPVEISARIIVYGGESAILSIARDITERKDAERALSESEEKFRGIFEQSNDGIMLADAGGTVTEWNRGMEEISGIPRSEAVGRPVSALQASVAPPGTEGAGETMHEAIVAYIATGDTSWSDTPLENDLIIAGGVHKVIQTRVYRIPAGDGFRAAAIVRDVTAIREAERAREQSEKEKALILDTLAEYLVFINPDMTVRWVNRATEELLGRPSEEIEGMLCHEAFQGRDTPCENCVLQKVRESGEAASGELTTPAGRFYRVSTYPVKDPGDGIVGYIEAGLDVTDQKAAEMALRKSETLFRTLAEVSPVGIFRLDRKGTCLFANRQWSAITGFVPRSQEGREWADFLEANDRREILARLLETENPDLPMSGEYRLRHPDGTIGWVFCQIAGLQDASGENAGYVGTITDVTRLKEAEEFLRKEQETLEVLVHDRTIELEKMNIELEHEIEQRLQAEKVIRLSLREKEVLLREIHHRVKNNLQIIVSLLARQARHLREPAAVEALRDSQNRVTSMALVHERLYRSDNLAAIDFSGYLHSLIEDLLQTYAGGQHRITLRTDIEESSLDIHQAMPLGLIMNELISNALKHAFPEDRAGTLTVTAHRDAGALRVTVGDDGTGMPADFDWRNTDSLGLHLVQSLVAQLRGTIDLAESGRGTTFTLKIPISREGRAKND